MSKVREQQRAVQAGGLVGGGLEEVDLEGGLCHFRHRQG